MIFLKMNKKNENIGKEEIESEDNDLENNKDELPQSNEDSNHEKQNMLDYEDIGSTKDIDVPPLLIDQVIGHEESVETIKKKQLNKEEMFFLLVTLVLENL